MSEPRPPGRDDRETFARNDRLYWQFGRLWVPAIALLVIMQAVTLPPGERTWLIMLTSAGLGGVALVGFALARVSAPRVLVVVALLIDCGAVATAATAAAGNDAAIFLPFLGGLLVVPFLDGRALAATLGVAWSSGMAGAYVAYALGPLRLVPDADPLVVNLAASGIMTGIGYGLLWWVRDRLTSAIRAARAAQADALRNERAVQTLIASSAVPTFAFDRTCAIRTWNAAATRLIGLTEAEVLGCRWPALVVAEDIPASQERVERALAGEVVRGERVRWLRAGGAEILVEVYLAAQRGPDGEPIGVVGQLIDVSEREMLQSRMAEMARLEAVGQLAGGIAHDFNNILAAMSGYAELLRQDMASDDPGRGDLDEIQRAGARGARLVRQLLLFSRRQASSAEALDLRALVDDLVPMLQRLIGAEVSIDIVPECDRCLIWADPTQIEQVIMNLALNARDAMAGGGRLTISTGIVILGPGSAELGGDLTPGSYARLTVEDTGLGMDAATLARIFEPFFTTKPTGAGTGLGLSTTYGIVRQSGGTISAASAPGQGSTFRVLLPLVRESAPSADASRTLPEPAGGSETVLVVDDEDPVREFARRTLERLGYNVLVADSPARACEMADGYPATIDLIVTDVVMPEMRGSALAARLRSARPALRILYMSGFAPDHAVDHEAPCPAGAFLEKPFLADDLARLVRSVLDRTDAAA
jgi:PAS domain S-box-containing protein